MPKNIKKEQRFRRHFRIRKTIKGTPNRPRLSVFRSNSHIYAQIIDDVNGKTLAASSSKSLKLKNGSNIEAAKLVASDIVKKAKALKINEIVFDRGGFLYHGRVKALADKAREEGLKF